MKRTIKVTTIWGFMCLALLFSGCDVENTYYNPPHTMIQLTFDDEILALKPVWSPSGNTILFLGCGNDGLGLWSIDPDGGDMTFLLSGQDMDPPVYELYPWDYSDDEYLLFSDDTGSFPNNIYYLAPEGGEPTFILLGSMPTVKGNLDGTYNIGYFYEYQTKGINGIYLTDIHGSEPQLVVEGDNIYYPDWSPDGTMLTYVRATYLGGGDWNYKLSIYDFATQNEKVIYKIGYYGIHCPRWSPDGEWIAFSMPYEGTSKEEVYIIPAEGGEPIRLTEFPYNPELMTAGVIDLSWSPDGKWIVFDLCYNQLWKVSVE